MKTLLISPVLLLTLLAAEARADLVDFARRRDPAFAWKLESNHTTPLGKAVRLALTSQTWRGAPWTHQLQVYEPAEVVYPDAALLFITGGSNGRKPEPEKDAVVGFALAQLCGARVAVLPQVPNQPLMGGLTEDGLISETFVNYLNTGEEDWPLLRPMVKSAVAAMDTVQEYAKEKGQPISRFVVTGASKRGWTTWLTGAVDDRVVAIAPMVIPTLNMKAQNKHQLEVWGKYSEQIDDYVKRGLVDKFDTPRGRALWKLVDPYSYLGLLAGKPSLQINGTNDRYWTLDSMNIFWDDINGPKNVVYLPNAGHGLDEHRDYATHGIAALFRHVIAGRPMPKLSWTHGDDPDGRLTLAVTAEPRPKSARAWTARTETRDFRESRWEPVGEDTSGALKVAVPRPESGATALFGDLTFEVDGLEYHLSTQIRIKEAPRTAAEAK